MTDQNSKELEVQKQEAQTPEQGERTRTTPVYIPRADIFETEGQVIVIADMPGVSETSIDITLEKNTLTIRGFVQPESHPDYTLSYAEYGVGDYERSFVLSNKIDQDHIEASVKNGVLRLLLPKQEEAKARKIQVKPQ
ncbi:MAG: Hsp20/alpha crystallin family protein [Anaerolineaceae bacterium]